MNINSDPLVFYANTVIDASDILIDELPEGTYLRAGTGAWWHKDVRWNATAIEDVPKELRLMALLLTG